MMPLPLLAAALTLLVVDGAVRLVGNWSGGRHTLIYLLLAYAPLLLVPGFSPLVLTTVSALVALGALISFIRLVGLRHDLGFAIPIYLLVPTAFAVAYAAPPAFFHALPVLGILMLVLPSTLRGRADSYLQKLCLGWVAFLVYGYLWGHAALLGRGQPLQIAILILLAKFADVAWVAINRLAPGRPNLQFVASPVGGLLGGAVLTAIQPPGPWLVLGGVTGFVLGLASRSHDLIVSDVITDRAAVLDDRPLKSTMMFGFGFVLAVVLQLWQWLA